MAIEVLSQVHHAMVIGIGLIELHERELRIVAGIHALVAEDAANLIDLVHAAHDQSLEVELQRNAKLHILVKRIEMRLKRTGSSAAGIAHQHRGFDLDKSLTIQILTDGRDDLGTLDEGIL